MKKQKKAWITIRAQQGYSKKVLFPQMKKIKSYAESKRKKEIRNEIVNQCKNLKSTKPILSLTSFECIQEKLIHKVNPHLKFNAVESNLQTFHKLLLNHKQHNYTFINKLEFDEVKNVINSSKSNVYSALLLDYCKTLITHKKEIITVIKNDLVEVNGFIYVNLSHRISNTKSKLQNIINNHGKGKYKITYMHSYHDTTTMCSTIIKRIK